jgi:hypothetical protein
MESLILASTLITAMAREGCADSERPLHDTLDDPLPALWTVLGAIAVAVLTGCAGTLLGG